MEPPCNSLNPENGLKVGLPLTHPEFCNWLLIDNGGNLCALDVEYKMEISNGEW